MAADLTLSPAPTASDDAVLLNRWARSRAAPVFEMIVHRHIDLVYTTALRYLGDTHLADDVTQAVFLILADKAASLQPDVSLPAWLHQTTRYAAANARKLQTRRRKHERIAAESRPETVMPTEAVETDAMLSLLDDAIGSLGSADRTLVIERYLKGYDVALLAARLGSSPRATQKRIERAVERLRHYFSSRGIGAASLSAIPVTLDKLSATSGAAPAHLVAAVSSAVNPTATVSSLAAETMRTMIWLKLKLVAALTSFALVSIATISGVGLVLAQRAATTTSFATQPVTEPSAPAFEAKLASGPTIELIGVCESPSAGKAWWTPDGTPLDNAPYTKAFVHLYDQDQPLQKDHVLREFALKVHPRLGRTGMERDWSFDSSYSSGNLGWICNPAEDGMGCLAMAIDPIDRPATLRFPIAAGPWQSRILNGVSPTSDAVMTIGEGPTARTISMTHPTEQDGSTRVSVTITQKGLDRLETRVIAIGRDGVKHTMTNAGGKSTKGEMLQQNFSLAMPINQLASTLFEMRPFDEWIEFRNVSLHANQPSNITIVTSDD